MIKRIIVLSDLYNVSGVSMHVMVIFMNELQEHFPHSETQNLFAYTSIKFTKIMFHHMCQYLN